MRPSSVRLLIGDIVLEDSCGVNRPGVVTGRKRLEKLQEQVQQRNIHIPPVYIKRWVKSDQKFPRFPIVLTLCFHLSQEHCRQVLQAASEHSIPYGAISSETTLIPLMIIRCNYGTSVRYHKNGKQQATKASNANAVVTDDEDTGNATSSIAAVEAAIGLAEYLHKAAPHYGIAVVLQSETRCWLRLTTWFDPGILSACKKHHRKYGIPLFSSHFMSYETSMLSAEDNTAIQQRYKDELDSVDMKLNIVS
jgi:hypothetical protein